MTSLVELLKKMLRDVALFVRCTGGIRLRRYQEAIARAVVHSVLHQQGLSFVVILPRQSGKNELQAQLQAYLLTLLSAERAEMVQVSPTWRPQTENAMHRLETVLTGNWLVKDRWEKHFGHVYQVGQARLVFLSGSPTTNSNQRMILARVTHQRHLHFYEQPDAAPTVYMDRIGKYYSMEGKPLAPYSPPVGQYAYLCEGNYLALPFDRNRVPTCFVQRAEYHC